MYDIFFHNLSAAEEVLEWMNKLEEGGKARRRLTS